MKNVINYYYKIVVNEFKKRENNFMFFVGKDEFEFVQFYYDANKLLNLYSILRIYRRTIDEIIFNKDKGLITFYDNKPYILLKKVNHDRKELTLYDIVKYDCIVHVKESLNWKQLWKEKLDYYQIQLDETGIKYPLLKQSFSYYLGLSEIAINILNYVNYDNINYCISHKRLEKTNDLFNPLNIIIDNKSRDIAEYIKIKYFTDDITSSQVVDFIKKSSFSKDEIYLLMSRLIYPSYYFDIYEKIYNGNDSEKDLNKIIKRNASYEAFLKEIYNYIKFLYNIPQIEFLEY